MQHCKLSVHLVSSSHSLSLLPAVSFIICSMPQMILSPRKAYSNFCLNVTFWMFHFYVTCYEPSCVACHGQTCKKLQPRYHWLRKYFQIAERWRLEYCWISSIMLQIILSFLKCSISPSKHFCEIFWQSKFWTRKYSNFLHAWTHGFKL